MRYIPYTPSSMLWTQDTVYYGMLENIACLSECLVFLLQLGGAVYVQPGTSLKVRMSPFLHSVIPMPSFCDICSCS